MGFSIKEEFKHCKNYIKRIHIKDRTLGGSTVRLGKGNVDFEELFKHIKKHKFKNSIVLQTARSKNDNDVNEIKINLKYLKKWL